jgi:outer membrane protein
MTRKFLTIAAISVFAACAALAQTAPAQTGASSGLPSAPSAAPDPAPVATGTKVASINIEGAIFATNEGQRDFNELSKKLEPKQTELKTQNDELEALKKQLNTQGDKLNEASRGVLVKQIEQKQKSFDRSVQDAREDAQNQQNEIAQRILQKLAPVMMKYVQGNGYGMVVDTSNPWPNGPVVWSGPSMDITKAVVDAYNAQSGVPAPVAPAAKPTASATRPSTPGAKPPAPSATTPKQ